MSNANMAKREFSSTLKNLKFMQRAAQRQEMAVKKEEVKPEEALTSPGTGVTMKCNGAQLRLELDATLIWKALSVVITEGDPHPGAVKGRLSFQSFNPSIDKLTEDASKPSQPSAPATSSSTGIGSNSLRENGPSTDGECSNRSESKRESSGERKRKQSLENSESESPNKSPENDKLSPKKKRKSDKKSKKDKLDYNLLRRPQS